MSPINRTDDVAFDPAGVLNEDQLIVVSASLAVLAENAMSALHLVVEALTAVPELQAALRQRGHDLAQLGAFIGPGKQLVAGARVMIGNTKRARAYLRDTPAASNSVS